MIDFLRDLNKLRPLFTRRDVWNFAFLLWLMFLGSVLEAVGIGAIPAFVTLVLKPSALAELRWIGDWFIDLPEQVTTSLLLWASAGLLLFVLLKNLFLTLIFYIQVRIITFHRVRLGDRMFKTYQLAPYQWHLQHSSSEMIRCIHNDTEQIFLGVLTPFLNLVMALIMTCVISVLMVLSTPGVALVALLITGIGLFVATRAFQKQLRHIGQVKWHEIKEMIKAIQQGFGSMIDARILGCAGYLNKVFRFSLKRFAQSQLRQQIIQKSIPYAMETFAVMGLLTILFLLIHQASSIEEVLPILALLGAVMIRLKQLATQIAAAINQINSAHAFIDPVMNDIQELESLEEKRRARSSRVRLINDLKSLHFEKVTYYYPGKSEPAVEDISLKIEHGEAVAFVGATGCGKSTLVNLILGLLEPSAGQVLVNGIDIHENIEDWHTHLGYVPQSIYLIDDTIRANVAFGIPSDEVCDDHLWSVLKSARLDEFVKAMPNGLDSIVGERGVRLSGGERQRLGVARALYTSPDVLVMDEATSALDNQTEKEVMEAIQNIKQGRTLIIVAHRLSTVEDCERLYFLEHGQIKFSGSFRELIKNSAAFRAMALHETG